VSRIPFTHFRHKTQGVDGKRTQAGAQSAKFAPICGRPQPSIMNGDPISRHPDRTSPMYARPRVVMNAFHERRRGLVSLNQFAGTRRSRVVPEHQPVPAVSSAPPVMHLLLIRSVRETLHASAAQRAGHWPMLPARKSPWVPDRPLGRRRRRVTSGTRSCLSYLQGCRCIRSLSLIHI
jgi:hypothetical protein